jgi:hypothetical protein
MSIVVGLSSEVTELQTENTKITTYRDRAAGIASDYLVPSEAIDRLAIAEFNKLTTRQTDLVSIGGNVGLGSTCYSSDTSYLTTTYGDLVSGVGSALGSVFGITGIGTTQVVAFGSINFDTLQAYRYPKIESGTLDASTVDPFDGEGYVTLTTANAGIGNSTRYTRGTGGFAGTVFALVNDCHVAISASITSLRSQYDSESVGISSFVSAATLVKGEKTEYQFHVWSYSRKINENSTGITSFTSVIDILEDPDFGGPY